MHKNIKLHEHSDQMVLSRPPKYSNNMIELASYRIIFLCEDITKKVSEAICAFLFYYDEVAPGDPITMYISSNGGDASGLAAIVDCFGLISSPVHTVCLARAYSAAAIILAAGEKGYRTAHKNSEVMIHGLQCVYPAIGKEHPVDSKNYYDFLNQDNNSVMKMLSEHTNQPLDLIKEMCKKDVFLTPKEALDLGIIDNILK